MDEARLPAQLEVGALLRRVQGEGGFAAVLRKGEADAGTILVVLVENGADARVFERMPSLEGARSWTLVKQEDTENKENISEYLAQRGIYDADLWIIELDIANGERFIGLIPPPA